MTHITCCLFFVLISYMLIGCNYSYKRFVKSVHRPYGPKMCMDLCSYSDYSFLYLTKDFTCYRIKVHASQTGEKRTKDSNCLRSNKSINDTTTLTNIPGWDICNKEFKETGQDQSLMLSGRITDNRCSPHFVQDTRDRTLVQASAAGELEVVRYMLTNRIADINCRGKLGRTSVMEAARNVKVAVFDFLVNHGSNLSYVNQHNNNVLHKACMGGSIDIVRTLLEHESSDIESKGEHQRTPVLVAIEYGNIDVVEYLVSKDCNFSAVDDNGFNILHTACAWTSVDMVKYVLTLGGAGIESSNYKGRTPVMVAAKHGKRDVVELLKTKSCKLKIVDKFGNNILHVACMNGNVDLVEFILAKGIVDIDSRDSKEDQTPAMIAAGNGHGDLVGFLVNKGCNLSAVDNHGNNVLHLACHKCLIDVVRSMLTLDVVDIDGKEYEGTTPVMKAAQNNCMDVVELFVDSGCNLTAVNKYGNNVLHLASLKCSIDVVMYILTLGIIDIDSRGYEEKTPVMKAAENNCVDLVQRLVLKGSNVTVDDKRGNNILHIASIKGRVDVVKYILSLGIIDIDIIGYEKKTAVMMAVICRRIGVVEILVNNGCNLKKVDKNDNNILHLACFGGHVEMVKYLLALKAVKGLETDNNRDWQTPVELAKSLDRDDIVAVFKQRETTES